MVEGHNVPPIVAGGEGLERGYLKLVGWQWNRCIRENVAGSKESEDFGLVAIDTSLSPTTLFCELSHSGAFSLSVISTDALRKRSFDYCKYCKSESSKGLEFCTGWR
jgi:hypothetical protein